MASTTVLFGTLLFILSTVILSGSAADVVTVDSILQSTTANQQNTTFSAQLPGTYTFEVQVTDGCSTYTDTVDYAIVCKQPPVAHAGQRQKVTKQCGNAVNVVLDGTSSRTVASTNDSVAATYTWTLESGPDGATLTSANINNATTLEASFSLDDTQPMGTYTFKLTVEDCCGTSEDTVEVAYVCTSGPVANAGGDQTVAFRDVVTLNASNSYDPNEDSVTYDWRIVKTPSSSDIKEDNWGANRGDQVVTFTPDTPGAYTVKLTVSDCCLSDTTQVTILVQCNTPPTARFNAPAKISGKDQTITLDAAASIDPDVEDTLVFMWTVTSKPDGSNPTIEGYNENKAEFTADTFGIYDVELTVSDLCSTASTTKSINVGCNERPLPRIAKGEEYSNKFPFTDEYVLNGCSTTDPDGDNLSYNWTMTAAPEDSASFAAATLPLTLSTGSPSGDNTDACRSFFLPDQPGVYTVQLAVSDNCSTEKLERKITIGCNGSPKANAGPDQTVLKSCGDSTAEFYGALSSDPDGDTLSYSWSFVTESLPKDSTLTDLSFVAGNAMYTSVDMTGQPNGIYTVKLTVSDGCTEDSDTVKVHFFCSRMPRASAGPDQNLVGSFPWDANKAIKLDGSLSSDQDSTDLSYKWEFSTVPEGSALFNTTDKTSDITAADKVVATFVPDVAGTYEIKLSVDDCCTTSTDIVKVTVSCGRAPQANAGKNKVLTQKCVAADSGASAPAVAASDLITLDGTGSIDSDSAREDLTSTWKLLHGPQNITITQSEPFLGTFYMPSITAGETVEEYVFEIEVDDGCSKESENTRVSVYCNGPPSALAGKDESFATDNPTVTLNGTLSHDPEDDLLGYQWTVLSQPQGSAVAITDADKAEASFSPTIKGEYELELSVSDCCHTTKDIKRVTLTCGGAPKVYAGAGQLIKQDCADTSNNVVSLEGTAEDEGDLTYSWTFVTGRIPDDSALTDDSITVDTTKATFTPDVPGDYVLKFTVSDGCSTVSDVVRVTFTCENLPSVFAGVDEVVLVNPQPNQGYDAIQITGATVSGHDTLSWKFISCPPGDDCETDPTTVDTTTALGQFTPKAPGCYGLELTASSCCGSKSDSKQICIQCNKPPTANAGDNQVVTKTADRPTVRVNGCDTADPDGDSIILKWTFKTVPKGSSLEDASILGSSLCNAQFTPDVTGEYELKLTVSDGCSVDTDVVGVMYQCNRAPIPNAGSAQSATKSCDSDTWVTLDGSTTVDPDDDVLVNEWSIVSQPEGAAGELQDADQLVAKFKPDKFGQYELQLTSQDDCSKVSDKVTVNFACNNAPVADAGPSQLLVDNPFGLVTLDGSGSYDTDNANSELTYTWSFLDKPATSSLGDSQIIDRNSPKGVFLPDKAGVYMLQLVVSDCCSDAKDTVKITVKKKGCSASPIVDVGDNIFRSMSCRDQNIDITLDGSRSTDLDTDEEELLYQWKVLDVPDDSAVVQTSITNANAPTAIFSPDVPGDYVFQLLVDDGCSLVADELQVTYSCNRSPTADAGDDQTIDDHSQYDSGKIMPTITLDGSGSRDPELDDLEYSWRFTAVPNKSVQSSDENTEETTDAAADDDTPEIITSGAKAQFIPTGKGCYELELTVKDCCSSSSDTVKVCLTCKGSLQARAGLDQVIRSCPPYAPISLDGTETTYSGDMTKLVYQWTVQTPPGVDLTQLDIANEKSATAYFTPPASGFYIAELTVYDGCTTSFDRVGIHISKSRNPPTARAGINQAVRWDGTSQSFPQVDLSGINSEDPDGDDISFEWTFAKVPSESGLKNADIKKGVSNDVEDSSFMTARFTPDVAGEFVVQLKVSDCVSSGIDSVTILVGCNTVPTVRPGIDQRINMGCEANTVQLDASAVDPDADPLTYEWSFTHKPIDSRLHDAKIVNRYTLEPSFEPDVTSDHYELSLTVSDGCNTVTESVKISFVCNQPPKANAGSAIQMKMNCTSHNVNLDASQSSDPEDDPLTYSWKLLNPPSKSTTTSDNISGANTVSANFLPDVTGLYEFELTVKDCCSSSTDRLLLSLTCDGTSPVPNAGDDQTVTFTTVNGTVTEPVVKLDASNSTDADGDDLQYFWSVIQKPTDSKVTSGSNCTDDAYCVKGASSSSTASSATAQFTADMNGLYVIQLKVTDCCHEEVSTVEVTVTCDDPPVVKAGADQVNYRSCPASSGFNAVTLKGSGTDTDTLTCKWATLSSPVGSSIAVGDLTADAQSSDATYGDATFTPDMVGQYVFRFTCKDGCSTISDETVVDISCRDLPVAEVWPEVWFKLDNARNTITLDGTNSTAGANGDIETYYWSFLSKPAGSAVTEGDIAAGVIGEQISTFDPDVPGDYEVQLEVSDCCGSTTATQLIHVGCSTAPKANLGEPIKAFWDGLTTFTWNNGTADLSGSSIAIPTDGISDEDTATSDLTKTWTLKSKPAASDLTDADIAADGTFTPDAFGTFVVSVEVTDGCDATASSDHVVVDVECNDADEGADAGDSASLPWTCEAEFPLEASFDSTMHQSSVSYSWSLVGFNKNPIVYADAGCSQSGLVDGAITLEHDTDVNDGWVYTWSCDNCDTDGTVSGAHNIYGAQFKAGTANSYTLRLTVSDGKFSASSTKTVDVANAMMVLSNDKTEDGHTQEEGTAAGDEDHFSMLGGEASAGSTFARDVLIGALALANVVLVAVVIVYRKKLVAGIKHDISRLSTSGSAGARSTNPVSDQAGLLTLRV